MKLRPPPGHTPPTLELHHRRFLLELALSTQHGWKPRLTPNMGGGTTLTWLCLKAWTVNR